MTSVKIAIFVLLSIGIQLNTTAQDIEYAKKCIKKLSSPQLHGRGYVKKGDLKAARFIATEFEDIGLESLSEGYFQSFNFSVNSFPSKMILKVDNTTLEPGYDFLISPSSPSIKGEFPVCILNKYTGVSELIKILNGYKHPFVLAVDWFELEELSDSLKSNLNSVLNEIHKKGSRKIVAILDYSKTKLTWTGSTVLFEIPRFTVKSEKFPLVESSEIYFNVKNEFIEQYSSRNIIGLLEGANRDSIIVVSAHYDHLGRMGKSCYFPGANDNASGVALMLNLAKELKKEDRPYSILFIAFAGEEIGLLGSGHFVQYPLVDLNKIIFLLNLDIAGTGDEGIQIVNGSIHKEKFELIESINSNANLLTNIKTRGAACNSDHCHFHERNVPSFFMYTLGGIKAYHDVYDKYETLPLTAYDGYFKLLKRFILSL